MDQISLQGGGLLPVHSCGQARRECGRRSGDSSEREQAPFKALHLSRTIVAFSAHKCRDSTRHPAIAVPLEETTM